MKKTPFPVKGPMEKNKTKNKNKTIKKKKKKKKKNRILFEGTQEPAGMNKITTVFYSL
jgi:hypothetical protein